MAMELIRELDVTIHDELRDKHTEETCIEANIEELVPRIQRHVVLLNKLSHEIHFSFKDESPTVLSLRAEKGGKRIKEFGADVYFADFCDRDDAYLHFDTLIRMLIKGIILANPSFLRGFF